MATWACLGSKCSQVRILLPGPDRFRNWIWDLNIRFLRDASRRLLERDPNPKSARTRSPTGRGACLRNKLMKVRILPRVPDRFGMWDLGFGIEEQIRNPRSHIRNQKGGLQSRDHRFDSDYRSRFLSHQAGDFISRKRSRRHPAHRSRLLWALLACTLVHTYSESSRPPSTR